VTNAAAEERKRSPLDAVHRRLGAKMGPFAGWEMPLEYAGTLSEHRAVRESVGIFDLTHLGKVEVHGPGARAALQHALSGDLDRLAGPGSAQYTLCLTDEGTIVDDLIVYWTAEGYLLVPNAANWPKVADAVRASADELHGRESAAAVEIVPRPDVAVLAVQGPAAPELVGSLFPAEVTGMEYMHAAPVTYAGETMRLARTGYTGERGYELLVPGELAAKLWDELFERGEPLGVVPAGLGARDTLRLEMGYPLHGNDISTETDPFEARLGWAVAMGKPSFRGREALAERKAAGTRRLLVGLVSTDRLIPRHGMAVLAGGEPVGEVTSGTFSPTLRHGIALAYVDRAYSDKDTELEVDVRGRRGGVRVTRPPFVDASPKDAPAPSAS
jgi:glycine cleavage system T protein (aminomethyltransferase)